MPSAVALSSGLVLALMAGGVLLAIAGHAARSRALVGLGLALVFLATAGLVLGAHDAYDAGPVDPRPPADPYGDR